MIKKLLRIAAFAFLSALTVQVSAQCTPDPTVTDPEGNGEMVPDTLYAVENTPINSTFTVLAPDTVSYSGSTINLHHLTVKSLLNKPVWLSYACNTADCSFSGTTAGCVLATGTPPLGSAGVYAMDVIVDVYITVLGNPMLAMSDYNSGMPFVVIVHPEGWGIDENASALKISQPQPNPFTNITKISWTSKTNQQVKFRVTDVFGKQIFETTVTTVVGENDYNFDGSELSNGIYFYSITDEQNRTFTNRFIKSK